MTPPTKRHKRYGQWLKSQNPQEPRSTAHRLDQIEKQPPAGGLLNSLKGHSDEDSDSNTGQGSYSSNESSIEIGDHDRGDLSGEAVDLSEEGEGGEEDVAGGDNVSRGEDPATGEENVGEGEDLGRGTAGGGGRDFRSDLDEPLFPGLSTTKFECLLMCFHLMLRNGLSYIALTHLLKMINTIFDDEVIPATVNVFERIFKGSFTVEMHFYCEACSTYLGEKYSLFPTADEKIAICSVCSKSYTLENLEKSSFFIYIPIMQQLKSFFETTPDICKLLKHRFERNVEEDVISDIFDGNVYKSLMAEGGFLSSFENVSISFNTDGAPVFRSSKSSLWPIQFCINDLTIKERFSKWNCMVAGLWFGKEEPDVSVFLTPFVLEAQKLYYEGFKWNDSSSGVSYLSKAIVLGSALDSIAKPKVQSVKQFNGYCGCTYCVHVGIMLPGHTHVKYLLDELPVIGDNYEPLYSVIEKVIDPDTNEEKEVIHRVVDRTDTGIRQDMEEVSSHPDPGYSVRGTKGESPLVALPYFDLVFGFYLDYLHAVLIGVTKLVTGFWLDSSSHNENYYIGLSVSTIDERLKAITPPSTGSLSRRPRSLKERALWKANEWRAWLLFYCLVCLKDILKPAYYKHHCLLVTAISILLKDRISKAELTEAAEYLFHYVHDFQILYGKTKLNFNVHLLLHIPKCVFMYGPLYCFSMFSWETGNGRLVHLVKGTRSVAGQISKKYVMSACIPEAGLPDGYHGKPPPERAGPAQNRPYSNRPKPRNNRKDRPKFDFLAAK